jgi:hypothetical protein
MKLDFERLREGQSLDVMSMPSGQFEREKLKATSIEACSPH